CRSTGRKYLESLRLNRNFLALGVPLCRIGPIERQESDCQHHEGESASFRPDGSTCEPARAVKSGIQQVAFGKQAAIRSRVDESLPVVRGGVNPDKEPKVASALQHQAPKHPETENRYRPDPAFPRMGKVHRAETRRQQKCRGPESDSGCQRVLRVTAEQKLLEDSDEHKTNRPKNRVFCERRSGEGQASKRKSAQRENSQNFQGFEAQAPGDALPEKSAKGSLQWKAVCAKRFSLDAAHDTRCEKYHQDGGALE